MAVKFPLIMRDGAAVRTIEKLREHFDLYSMLHYYINGQLEKWLIDRGYDEEAEKVKALDSHSENFYGNLCEIFNVPYSEDEGTRLQLSNVAKREERLNFLKKFTANDVILEAVDSVAFTREELIALLRAGVKKIYLCGGDFSIPGSVGDISYIGVNNPAVEIDGNIVESGIDFQNVRFNRPVFLEDSKTFFRYFSRNEILGIKLLREAAGKEDSKAYAVLGSCYMTGFGSIEKNEEEAVKWYQKAAKNGNARAQSDLGHCYKYGIGIGKDMKKAVDWSRKAAEQGDAQAQTRLGICCEKGESIVKNEKEAVYWYQKAAQQGYARAQYYLGICYKNGCGVKKNEKEATKWLIGAYKQGDKAAKPELMSLDPKLFRLSDVILCVVGGEDNLIEGTKINAQTGEIDIFVDDRKTIDIEMLRRFGAVDVRIDKVYFIREKSLFDRAKEAAKVGGEIYEVIRDPIGYAYFAMKKKANDKEVFPKFPKENFIQEDLGQGCIHLELKQISPAMKRDFTENVLPLCRRSSKGINIGL